MSTMTFTEIDSQTTHHAAMQVGKFECRKGQDCEARRVRNSYDDDFPKVGSAVNYITLNIAETHGL
jgi:hypothetical protein